MSIDYDENILTFLYQRKISVALTAGNQDLTTKISITNPINVLHQNK